MLCYICFTTFWRQINALLFIVSLFHDILTSYDAVLYYFNKQYLSFNWLHFDKVKH